MQFEGHAGQEALESSQEAQEVHGGGCEAAEKHALGTVDAGQEALEAAVEQVLVAADAGQDAVAPGTEEETVQTPCKGERPTGGAARHPGKACRGGEAEARAPQEGSK